MSEPEKGYRFGLACRHLAGNPNFFVALWRAGMTSRSMLHALRGSAAARPVPDITHGSRSRNGRAKRWRVVQGMNG